MTRLPLAVSAAALVLAGPAGAQEGVTKYVRYAHDGHRSYGVLEGETVHELEGDLFGSRARTGRHLALEDVRLLAPCQPSKVIAVGLNYRSHLGEAQPAEYPGLFLKLPTSIIGTGDAIVMPADATDLHYEAELVLVIGKKAKNVPVGEAQSYVFGVTAGNDVSERVWQHGDLQWLRGKASDTFGPLGPVIVAGLDYGNLAVESRVNGEVRQKGRTSDLIFDIDTIVSYISRYVTLLPGDVIFTGTPGRTRAMKPGDVVEVEVQGVGTLRNTVAAAH